MNTEHLRYILIIDEYQSINKAAKTLYMTQSTLSKVLQKVEDSIGIKIFVRNNRGVEATEEGRIFIRRIKSTLKALDDIERDYFDAYNAPKDLVNIIIGSHRSTPALDAFLRFYLHGCLESKHINLEFYEDSLNNIISGVCDNIINLGVLSYVSSREDDVLTRCNQNNLNSVLLHDGSLYMQISESHPLAHREKVWIDELKDYTQITFSDENFAGINYCSNVEEHSWKHQEKRIVTNSRGVLRTLILNSDGYYLGNNAKCELLDKQGTVCIPVADYPYTVKTAYIYRKSCELTKEERRYISYLKEVFEKV